MIKKLNLIISDFSIYMIIKIYGNLIKKILKKLKMNKTRINHLLDQNQPKSHSNIVLLILIL
jgi:hypothetical protein